VADRTPLFTVFTPTYNRAYCLPRVFNCLTNQTFKDFEWIIIDDGSTDNTKELVEQWQEHADFPIVYQWQSNQGKHIAYNAVTKLAKGTLFTSIDSDDEIIAQALEILAGRWGKISEEQKTYIAGALFVSKDQYGNIVGDPFPTDGEICDMVELLLIRKVKGDKGGFLQTKVMRMYPFPEEVKNVLVPEGVFIHRMSQDWKVMCINDVLRIYWIDERDDHLGSNFSGTKSYKGLRLSNLAILNYSCRFFLKAPKIFLATAAHYTKMSFAVKIGLRKQYADIKTTGGRIVWLLTLPAGWLLYAKENRKHS
jgi:glycosyltransferase involved in cell wall biosynthesis